MQQRYFLEIAFDGSNYFGWQIQPKHITVQATIEKVLTTLFNQPTAVVGCGRTDTGVHAQQYFAHFDAPIYRSKLFDRIKLMLPQDIQLLALHPVEPTAHCRFDATERSYTYYLHHKKAIFKRHYSLSTNLKALNEKAIQTACTIFLQERNYLPLCKKNMDLNNHFSEIKKVSFLFDETKETAEFSVTANRFLHNQIRRMVGALLDIGNGKLSTAELQTAMQQNQQLSINNTVAPHALFLHSIKYPYICTQ